MSTKKDTEARIIIRRRPQGGAVLDVYDPQAGKLNQLGMIAQTDYDIDRECRRLAEQLKRAGHRVSVKEM